MCGITGVYSSNNEASRLAYFGLFALQHRGQESAGIAVHDGQGIKTHKDLGLVSQVFNERDLVELKGNLAIGHNRYSTTGSNSKKNCQPFIKSSGERTIALVHNGNLTNALELRIELEKQGEEFESTSDSELIAALIIRSKKKELEDAVMEACNKIRGASSLVILAEGKVIAARDPNGIRPLSLGSIDGNYIFASETCGLDVLGARFICNVLPGQIVSVSKDGVKKYQFAKPNPTTCIFEFVYFSRPDSLINSVRVHEARREMGRWLARLFPVEADLVISIPSSGDSAAFGYAEESKIPLEKGLIKNYYVGRTFINPTQDMRQLGIRMKLNPLPEVIKRKRLIVIDDSIVRGNTSKKLVNVLWEAGAREVHMRISCPPIIWPCFYGVDTADREQLIASKFTIEQICAFLGADTLGYLPLEKLVSSVGLRKENLCCACFDGNYPIEIPEIIPTKHILESTTA